MNRSAPQHTIRLRPPWQTEVGECGECRFRRRFGRPTGIQAGDRVDLVVRWTGPHSSAEVAAILIQLNEDPAGPWQFDDGILRLDVTGRLGPRNELWIDLPSTFATQLPPSSPSAEIYAELPWSVQLEIFVAAG